MARLAGTAILLRLVHASLGDAPDCKCCQTVCLAAYCRPSPGMLVSEAIVPMDRVCSACVQDRSRPAQRSRQAVWPVSK